MKLGIDIDTHHARAAYLDERGQPQLLCLPDGDSILPAMARQTFHGLQVGPDVAQSLAGNAETTLQSCVRLMGRAENIPASLQERLPYPMREQNGEAICNLLYAEVRPSTVYAQLVQYLVQSAESQLGQDVEAVVLTVPASAEDRFRLQAREAVESQGIHVSRLLNQPTAALLAADLLPDSVKTVAIVACTGGNCDVSVAQRQQNEIQILATAGDMTLGGDDLAWALAEQLNQRFIQQAGVDVFAVDESKTAAYGLRRAAEEALNTLRYSPQATLVLDHGGGFGRDLMTILTRAEVDAWLSEHRQRLQSLCQRAMKSAKKGKRAFKAKDINAVILTGSWATLPPLAEAIAEIFERPVAKLYNINSAELPAFGAALAAQQNHHNLWDVTPYPLGINCYYGDEELFSPIITANTPIPTPQMGEKGAYTASYTTRNPNQSSVTLDILQYRGPKQPATQGANKVYPNECELLGTWQFSNLKPKRGQRAPFTVTFTINRDGILALCAQETATGHQLVAQVNRNIG